MARRTRCASGCARVAPRCSNHPNANPDSNTHPNPRPHPISTPHPHPTPTPTLNPLTLARRRLAPRQGPCPHPISTPTPKQAASRCSTRRGCGARSTAGAAPSPPRSPPCCRPSHPPTARRRRWRRRRRRWWPAGSWRPRARRARTTHAIGASSARYTGERHGAESRVLVCSGKAVYLSVSTLSYLILADRRPVRFLTPPSPRILRAGAPSDAC